MTVFQGGMTPANYYTGLNQLSYLYNVLEYGAVRDGNTDDTVAIQAAINAAVAGGGGRVFLPKGDYKIAGALQRNIGGIDYKSQLYIPESTFANRIVVEIVGEFTPNMAQSWGFGGGGVEPIYGTKLISTINNNTVSGGYVIATKGTNLWDFNYNHVYISNLQVCVTADSNHKLTLGGINLSLAGSCGVSNTTVFPYNKSLMTTAEPTYALVGINLPNVNGELNNFIENCHVGGFVSGYAVGDHATIHNSSAFCCVNGLEVKQNNFTSVVTKLYLGTCKNYVTFTGGASSVIINELTTETQELTKWYDLDYHINDVNNYGTGIIRYSFSNANPNAYTFNKNGGEKLRCMFTNFWDKAQFTVTGARDESEGALKDLITKLVAQGIIIDGTTAS
jgi:hypothetical protein